MRKPINISTNGSRTTVFDGFRDDSHKPLIVCLMGPTASGKTQLAIELVKRLPFEIISVDSAMIYRGMDIGTAKPSLDVLKEAPHRLLDIIDPGEHYSAGDFCRDAMREIHDIIKHGKTPLLVGGTMMYFRALQKGMATLPMRDESLRLALNERAKKIGWEALHAELKVVDPLAASRISANDSQRIQRALEVFMLTGKSITQLQQDNIQSLSDFEVINIAIAPEDRKVLHDRIAIRFHEMLNQGFIHEAHKLFQRFDLNRDMPSMRAVGYRQAFQYFAEEITYEEMIEKAIIATRQLAKRQMTWLRSFENVTWFNSTTEDLTEKVLKIVSS